MRFSFFLIVIFLWSSCVVVKPRGIIANTYKTSTGWKIPYNIFYPKNFGKKKLPLFIWLHGAGERGDDNVSQLIHIVPYLCSDMVQTTYPCIVLAPQCPEEGYWAPVKRHEWVVINNGTITPSMHGFLELLDFILKDSAIDKSRVYVGGLSMGGFGTYDILSRRPDLFAAAVPICGGADLGKIELFKDIPLWVFHGSEDLVVNPQISRNLIEMLKQKGRVVRYTEYKGKGHDIWNEAIKEPELLPWLFSQRNSKL